MESGRDINIDELLRKEPYAIPLSLATTDYTLRSTNKAELVRILEAGVKETQLSTSNLKTWTIIDGMALVRAMRKPLINKFNGGILSSRGNSLAKYCTKPLKPKESLHIPFM